jgi:TrwC relaxase
MHKLTAGSGYDYLTRQVAALDATDKGHTGLTSYYTERGETPGGWIGSGLDGIDGLTAGDPVTCERCSAAVCIRWPSCASSSWKGRTSPLATFRMRPVLELRSRSSMVSSARSGSRWPNASGRSIRRPACRRALPCPLQTGRGCGPTWPGSSSSPSMAANPLTRGSWRDRSRKTRGHGHKQLPVTI